MFSVAASGHKNRRGDLLRLRNVRRRESKRRWRVKNVRSREEKEEKSLETIRSDDKESGPVPGRAPIRDVLRVDDGFSCRKGQSFILEGLDYPNSTCISLTDTLFKPVPLNWRYTTP